MRRKKEPAETQNVIYSPDALLTDQQLATYLQLKPQSLRLWRSAHRGSLPYIRLGRRAIRYRFADVQAWLTAHVETHEVRR